MPIVLIDVDGSVLSIPDTYPGVCTCPNHRCRSSRRRSPKNRRSVRAHPVMRVCGIHIIIRMRPLDTQLGSPTLALATWAAGFRLEHAPVEVVDRMKLLVLDFFRVVAVGAGLPWSRGARNLMLELGGNGTSTVLLYGDRLDASRAAFVNGAFAHACDLDDTHVGSMHHAGASILPAVFAMAERTQASGKQVLEAAICGYEASLRIGLAVAPSAFHRGFMPTSSSGVLGAAIAAGKLLDFQAQEMAGALGAAANFAGGLAQFYKSGSTIKRINGGHAAESGVVAALLTRHGISGPTDILEGESGFFRAFADQFDASHIEAALGQEFRLMEVSTKVHAGAGRLQATTDAGLALASEHQFTADQIVDIEAAIPKVIQGRLTHASPQDMQSAQMSVPFALAIALTIGSRRGANAGLRPDDYELGLASSEIQALAVRVRCVLDDEIERATTSEEVPAKVTVRLADGRLLTARVAHPRGSPKRRMSMDEVRALFCDTAAPLLPDAQIARVTELVTDLDRIERAEELVTAFTSPPGRPLFNSP